MKTFLKLTRVAAQFFFFSLILMLLWNWLMPLLFGLIQITYWQAVGIKILSTILFKRMIEEESND